MTTSYSYMFKLIIIGDSSVGKSCILLQFTDSRFRTEHDATIGVEYASKMMKIDGKTFKLQIWDTAGQEAFRSITRSYYRGTIGALLVYDIADRHSFESCEKWLHDTMTFGNENTTVILIGNKCDLEKQREVSYEEGLNFAKKNGLFFIETSGKTGVNVNEAFKQMTEIIVEKLESGEIDPEIESNGIKIGTQALNVESKPTRGIFTKSSEKLKKCAC